jgi:Zn-dependent protease
MFIETLFTDPILFVRIIAILIVSICLHELAHGYAAMSQGDDTPQKSGHLTLNPVVHMGVPSLIFLCLAGITWGQMPVDTTKFRSPRFGNMLVSAAGPLMNLSLSIAAIALLITIYRFNLEWASMEFFYLFARINIMLCLFNLLPIPPLDGFHVFSEVFPGLKVLQDSPIGFFLLALLFITPFFGQMLSAIATAGITGALHLFIS